jgi:hypothetical protein
MDNAAKPSEQELDQQLASFADQLLDKRGEHEVSGDAGMNGLEETIIQLNTAAQAARPDPAASARMRKNIMAQWQKPAPSWQLNFSWLRYALAASAALFILAAAFLLTSNGETLTGAAQGSWLWPAGLVIAGIILIIVILRKEDQS